MLTSARHIINVLEISDDTIEDKIEPTGPHGAPGNKRWICSRDIYRYQYEVENNRNTRKFFSKLSNEPYNIKTTSKKLWDYQNSAVNSVINSENIISSGNIEMDCGTGKTLVGCELIRRIGAPSMVVTSHIISSKQWVKDLSEHAHLNVEHIHNVDKSWKKKLKPFPDVIVCTYASITRAFKSIQEKSYEDDDTILWLYIVKRFGILILDEVHLVAADQFRLTCLLNFSSVVGFSGSLIREDEKLLHLNDLVGPVLFTYLSGKKVMYGKICVSFDESMKVKSRSKEDYTIRTLNPNKMCALNQIIRDSLYLQNRIIIFSDSATSINYIQLSLNLNGRTLCGSINGKTKESDRSKVLEHFYETKQSILISSSVCNVAVNFPDDCIVIQLHNSNGSRCQEMQRCGRSGRGEIDTMKIIHVLNKNTEEEKFYNHRLEHMRNHYKDTFEEYDISFLERKEPYDLFALKTYLHDYEKSTKIKRKTSLCFLNKKICKVKKGRHVGV